MNKKAIIIVLDSVGIGELPDAANYGDKGADTLGHIINTCHPKSAAHDGAGPGEYRRRGFLRRGGRAEGLLRQAARGFRGQGHDHRPLGDRGHSAGARIPDVPERLPAGFYREV